MMCLNLCGQKNVNFLLCLIPFSDSEYELHFTFFNNSLLKYLINSTATLIKTSLLQWFNYFLFNNPSNGLKLYAVYSSLPHKLSHCHSIQACLINVYFWLVHNIHCPNSLIIRPHISPFNYYLILNFFHITTSLTVSTHPSLRSTKTMAPPPHGTIPWGDPQLIPGTGTYMYIGQSLIVCIYIYIY